MLYLALIALLSLGVAALVRDSAVSIGAVLALLYLFPVILSFIGNAAWQHRLERWTPTVAGLDHSGHHRPAQSGDHPWAGLGVLAMWAAAACWPVASCSGSVTSSRAGAVLVSLPPPLPPGAHPLRRLCSAYVAERKLCGTEQRGRRDNGESPMHALAAEDER